MTACKINGYNNKPRSKASQKNPEGQKRFQTVYMIATANHFIQSGQSKGNAAGLIMPH